MKKKPEDATIEEILTDITHWEDIDAALIVSATKSGGAFVEGEGWYLQKTREMAEFTCPVCNGTGSSAKSREPVKPVVF